MKLLFVIQRYGAAIMGGAELHCRLVAEKLSANHSVEIATTCASDYLTWANDFEPGSEIVNGLSVHRFPVERERPVSFDDLAYRVLNNHGSHAEQVEYLAAHGPYCPGLVHYLKTRHDIDRFIFFSYRYWITRYGIEAIGSRAILVPTAEHDRVLYLPIHRNSFHLPCAIAYNSYEEKRLIERITGNTNVPGDIIGTGLPDAVPVETMKPLAELDLLDPYVLYIGRIERAKGCSALLANYLQCFRTMDTVPELVLVGDKKMDIPDHSRIRYLGTLSESEKQAVLNRALFLIMPSQFESLSMVLLEAWRVQKPVLCNGHCDVLRGQCRRSNGGLYYRNSDEFLTAFELLLHRQDIRMKLGISGCNFYQSNYDWNVIINKYELLLKGDTQGQI
jgi:glycosyltransferase involved in cell wall biosynthesis